MRIVVVGGTGSLGRAVIAAGKVAGHEMVAASRRGDVKVDVATGEGLAQVFAGADVVIETTNAPPGGTQVMVHGTRRVLEAANAAGVPHFIGISIVGIDQAPLPYYRMKVAQEKVIEAAPVPWTLLRATQFHDLIPKLARPRYHVVLAPRGFKIQPIHVREVGSMLVAAAAAGPQKRLPDAGGPAVRDFVELARLWKSAAKRSEWILPVPLPGARCRFLRAGGLCCPDRAVGTIPFEAWLAETYGGRDP